MGMTTNNTWKKGGKSCIENREDMERAFREAMAKRMEHGASNHGNESWQTCEVKYFISKVLTDLWTYSGSKDPTLLVDCANFLMMAWAVRQRELDFEITGK